MRGVSLDEISAATRIATRFLRAIEDEQWDQLPGGVFNRGFVRAVARYLGLDEEDIVAEYGAAAGDGPTVPVWTGRPPAVTPDQPWLAWILIAVIALTFLMGGWFAARRISAWRASRRAVRVTSASDVASPEQPATPSASEAVPVAGEVAPNSPQQGVALPDNTDPSAAGGAISSSAAAFELKVEAGETTSVTVNADLRTVFEGIMKSGEEHTFTAQDKFQVTALDAGAVQLELNGKRLAPMGPRGQGGKVTITREGLKGIGGGGN